jgi:leucyl aminopeptidase
MNFCLLTPFEAKDHAILLYQVEKQSFEAFLSQQTPFHKEWLYSQQFTGEPRQVCALPDQSGKIQKVVFGSSGGKDCFWDFAFLCKTLPQGIYRLDSAAGWDDKMGLAWGLATYHFTKYKTIQRQYPHFVLPQDADQAAIERMISSIFMVRDLINTPTSDMGPEQLEAFAKVVANNHQAEFSSIVGKDLLTENYPLIYAVGKAGPQAPRLIDITWGEPHHPKVTLVGKGVCFDTGGLDLKTSSGMRLMKKDMGGAAHVLALGNLIMETKLPVRLRVLVPAVENSVSHQSMRPGDVYPSRKGPTIEIGNTDAEGRLILADALAEASSENPEILIDYATLTGAARVALGPDLPALFSNSDEIAQDLLKIGTQESDPMWQLPLWEGYRSKLKRGIADLDNDAGGFGFAGATIAGLFLNEFVYPETPWVHLDLIAWNLEDRPGRPQGGEAMALRSVFAYLEKRFKN